MRWLRCFLIGTILTGALLAFSWSLLQPGMFQIHDYTQVGRLVELRRSLEAGHFPVIWSQNFGYGYGMPLFLFYGPLPFYFGTFATWLGFSDLTAIKLLFLLSNVLGLAGVFAWFRPRGYAAATAASVIFLAMPYRALDIFVRGALNEILAISLLPWVLVATRLMSEKPRQGIVMSATVTAALLLTHNLTTLLGLPILAGLALLWILLTQTNKLKMVLQFGASQLLGLLAAAFFVIPSLVENHLTAIDSILSGYFDFRLHFLSHRQLVIENWGFGGSQLGLDDGISFHLGSPAWLALILSAIMIGSYILTTLQKKANFTFKHISRQYLWLSALCVATGFSIFMTIGRSQPVWEILPLLHLAQFPWRFLAVASVMAALVAGELIALQKTWWTRWPLALLLGILACTQVGFHRPKEFLKNPDKLYSSQPEFIRTDLSKTLPDFLPTEFDQDLDPVSPEQRIVVENQTLQIQRNQPHSLLFEAENSPGTITWNIADFPGWKYFVNNQAVEPALLPDGRRQLESTEPISLIAAEFTRTPLRLATQIVSLGTFAVLGALLIPWEKTMRELRKYHAKRT